MAPDPLAHSRPRFSLNPIAIALVVLACAGRMYVGLFAMEHDQGMFWVTDVMAGITGTILFSIGPAWLVWRMTGRRRFSATATCIILLFLINLGYVNSLDLGDRQANDEALDTFNRAMDVQSDQQADLLDRANAGEDVSAEGIEKFDQDMRIIEQLSDDSSGQQAHIFAIVAKVMRRLQDPAMAYNDTLNRFAEAGGIEAATMLDRAEISRRLRLVEEFAAANDQFAVIYASLEADLRAQLLAENIDEDRAEFFIDNWRRGARPDLIAQLRQTDRDLAESFRGIVNTLDAAFGRWSIDSDLVIFDDDTVLDQYNVHFNRMNEAVIRQETINRQIQQAIKSRQNSP